MRPLPFLLALLALAIPQGTLPDTGRLLADARGLVPAYEGEHRSFLTTEVRTHVRAAVKLLEAIELLEPENAQALWWLAHARTLLGEDARNRGHEEEARATYAAVLAALDRSLELDPQSFWAQYSRGIAHLNLGDVFTAIVDLGRAADLAREATQAEGDTGNAAWLLFQARRWRAEALMRAQQFDEARDGWRAFYADYGNNAWDLGIALAQAYLRERDFAGAAAQFEQVIEAYPTDFKAYADLAYVEGLRGNTDAAVHRLEQAIEREFDPSLYTRLWLYMLADGDRKSAALDDLREYTENPPASLSDWDRTLGAFLVGQRTHDAFMKAATDEVGRRMANAEELDDLLCEAWFYAGWRHELDGHPREALEAYERSLAFRPDAFKWEWAYARLRFGRLARQLGGIGLEKPSEVGGGESTGFWHVLGTDRPVSELGEPGVGDLFLGVRVLAGRRVPILLVVGLP